jgi:hypothetical protein
MRQVYLRENDIHPGIGISNEDDFLLYQFSVECCTVESKNYELFVAFVHLWRRTDKNAGKLLHHLDHDTSSFFATIAMKEY